MTELSPAEIVLKAWKNRALNSREWEDGLGPRLKLAAALRALVDSQSDYIGDRLCVPVYNILEIANELDPQP